SLIERKRERFQQLVRAIADPRLFDNRKRASEAMREHGSIKQLLTRWDELEAARRQLDENRELAMSNDVEIAAMADDEIPDLQKRVVDLEREMQIAFSKTSLRERRASRATGAGNGSAGPHSYIDSHGRRFARSQRGRYPSQAGRITN